jgi:hypothetical protein
VQGKQAKIVSPTQERAILGYLDTTRYPSRDRVMFLLSMKAGLRAKEMASLSWAMVTDATGQVGEAIQLQNRASKGKTGGRTIPLHPDKPRHGFLDIYGGLSRPCLGGRRCDGDSMLPLEMTVALQYATYTSLLAHTWKRCLWNRWRSLPNCLYALGITCNGGTS